MSDVVITRCPMCGGSRHLTAEEADTPPRWWKWFVVCDREECEQEPVQVIPVGAT